MVKLKPGDRVDVRIKASVIVGPYKDYDEIRTFEIIATDKFGYYLYVPDYVALKHTQKADKYQCNQLHIDYKFLDVIFIYIHGNMVCRISSILDGMTCAHCKEFKSMAEPNQPDDKFLCYDCRFNPYR
jgi:hypothetical protein